MLLIGLTGGIASGKSTVSRYLVEKGVTVIDADMIAAEVVQPGKPAYNKIREAFGPDIIKSDETLNRELLAEIIFSDAEKRKILNSITHPYIRREIAKRIFIACVKLKRYVVLDLPLLFEASQFISFFHKIIVVKVSKETQLIRLLKRDKLVKSQAEARIDSQLPLDIKCTKANYVINNDGSVKSTMKQVDLVVNQLNNSYAYLRCRIGILLCLMNVFCLTYLFAYRYFRTDLRNKS